MCARPAAMRGWRRRMTWRGAAGHGRGRTWYLASRLLAAIEAVSPGNRILQNAALAGLVGDQALPFLEYRENLNLPDPEDILKSPRSLVLPDRIDRAYAVCYSLVGAVLNNKTPNDGRPR